MVWQVCGLMANSLVSVIESASKMHNIKKALKWTKNNYVLVGIPQKSTDRPKSNQKVGVTNAELLFMHTNGSPINNVPARPVIEPAIYNDRERIAKMLSKAFSLKLDGKNEEAEKQLKLVGMRSQNVCRAWFTNPDNGWPPNAPSVYNNKLKKGSTDPKPLIDTGELRKSITYVVVKDGVRVD